MTRDLTERAARVLTIEAEGLLALRGKLDRQFTRAVDMLLSAPGKVIVTGMGKSGLIGRKIAATLASTGTPAFFLHPAEGLHGDIGMVLKGDVVIALSNSGETQEVVRLLPVFKRLGLELIALTGNSRGPSQSAFGSESARSILPTIDLMQRAPSGEPPNPINSCKSSANLMLTYIFFQTTALYA